METGDMFRDKRKKRIWIIASLFILVLLWPPASRPAVAEFVAPGDAIGAQSAAVPAATTVVKAQNGTISLSGRVVAGPVNGAAVTVYNAADLNTPLASTNTDSKGDFTLNIASQANPVVLTATGGTYRDEATQAMTNLSMTLRLALPSAQNSQTVAITPVTEAAVQYAFNSNGGLTADNITSANNAARTFLYGIDPVATLPSDPTDAEAMSTATDQQKIYSAVMGIISQFMKNNGVTLATLLSWQKLTVPCTKPATLPNAFLGNNCQGIYRTGETTQLTAGAFGFLSDPDSLFLNSSKSFLGVTSTTANNQTGFTVYGAKAVKPAARTAGGTGGAADSAMSSTGQGLSDYLDSFDLENLWVGITTAGYLVNWKTGAPCDDGKGAASIFWHNKSDTFCSSFVSAVVWKGWTGEKGFAQAVNAVSFLHPYNNSNIQDFPNGYGIMGECAPRNELSDYQQSWLLEGAAMSNPPPDYDPIPANSGWSQLTSCSAINAQIPSLDCSGLTHASSLTATDAMIVAQRLANLGYLVIASFKAANADKPGHITAVRPSLKSTQIINGEGPDTISAGQHNSANTSLRQAFNVHSCNGGEHNPDYCPVGAWESMSETGETAQIRFFYYLAIGGGISWNSDNVAAAFVDYGAGNGIWSYDGNQWNNLTKWQPTRMIGYGAAGEPSVFHAQNGAGMNIAAAFNAYGNGNGLWRYNGASWNKLTDWIPVELTPYGSTALAGKFTDYGDGNGVWKYDGSWRHLTDWLPNEMTTLGNDVLVGNFAKYGSQSGVYGHDGVSWQKLSDWTPEQMVSWGSRLAAVFTNYGAGGNGVWIYENSGWRRATDWMPVRVLSWNEEAMLAGVFSDYGSGNGIWNYDGSSWNHLTDWLPAAIAKLGPDGLAAVFKAYGSSGNGIWEYRQASSTWSRITAWVPDAIGSSGDYLTAVFTGYGSGNGIWKYRNGTWIKLTDWVPKESRS